MRTSTVNTSSCLGIAVFPRLAPDRMGVLIFASSANLISADILALNKLVKLNCTTLSQELAIAEIQQSDLCLLSSQSSP